MLFIIHFCNCSSYIVFYNNSHHSYLSEFFNIPFQGTPRLSTEPLSSRLHQEKCPLSEDGDEKQTTVDLWSTDDGVVDYKMDNENSWDNWPPPLSHIPLVSPSEDAAKLGQDAWPRTAPKRRSAVDVEARCLAQLERARKYHPRLFPPRPMRTASERTAASRSFLVLLYNNEYHNYEQVIFKVFFLSKQKYFIQQR